MALSFSSNLPWESLRNNPTCHLPKPHQVLSWLLLLNPHDDANPSFPEGDEYLHTRPQVANHGSTRVRLQFEFQLASKEHLPGKGIEICTHTFGVYRRLTLLSCYPLTLNAWSLVDVCICVRQALLPNDNMMLQPSISLDGEHLHCQLGQKRNHQVQQQTNCAF